MLPPVLYDFASTIGVASLGRVFGDAAGGSGNATIDLVVPYLNLGFIVVIVIMTISKKGFVPKWVLDDREKAHEKEMADLNRAHEREVEILTQRAVQAESREEEYKRLNADLQTYQRDQLQPALIESTRIVAAYVAALSRRGGDV